ncbi:Uncharacterised protein [Vibrio cholerae]|nr:Uncharacterised protein [Vibrio cholerae]
MPHHDSICSFVVLSPHVLPNNQRGFAIDCSSESP